MKHTGFNCGKIPSSVGLPAPGVLRALIYIFQSSFIKIQISSILLLLRIDVTDRAKMEGFYLSLTIRKNSIYENAGALYKVQNMSSLARVRGGVCRDLLFCIGC